VGKKLKRKLGKKVLAGELTVDEARARLGRAVVRKSAGTAWSTWPAQAGTMVPREPDEEYVLEAVRAQVPGPDRPSPRMVEKARRRHDQDMAPFRVAVAKGLHASTFPALPPAPAAARQLSPAEQQIVTGLRGHLALVGHDPARREAIGDQIARLTGTGR
jgi:hypothetical protein